MISSLNSQAFFADSLGISIFQTPNHQHWLYIEKDCNCNHELLWRRQDPGNLWWLCGQTVTSQQSEPFRRIRSWRATSSLSFTPVHQYIAFGWFLQFLSHKRHWHTLAFSATARHAKPLLCRSCLRKQVYQRRHCWRIMGSKKYTGSTSPARSIIHLIAHKYDNMICKIYIYMYNLTRLADTIEKHQNKNLYALCYITVPPLQWSHHENTYQAKHETRQFSKRNSFPQQRTKISHRCPACEVPRFPATVVVAHRARPPTPQRLPMTASEWMVIHVSAVAAIHCNN